MNKRQKKKLAKYYGSNFPVVVAMHLSGYNGSRHKPLYLNEFIQKVKHLGTALKVTFVYLKDEETTYFIEAYSFPTKFCRKLAKNKHGILFTVNGVRCDIVDLSKYRKFSDNLYWSYAARRRDKCVTFLDVTNIEFITRIPTRAVVRFK